MRGVCFPFAGSAAPNGFLLCYGQPVSRTNYAALFALIGTTFGVGDGSTTFNVPDLRGRGVAGKDNMGGVAAGRLSNTGTGAPNVDGSTLGASGGTDRHQLTAAQMPSHTHAAQFNNTNSGGSYPNITGAGPVVNTYATTPAGSDQAHPNVQPTMVMNWIIKY